jgi:hypothetical protein
MISGVRVDVLSIQTLKYDIIIMCCRQTVAAATLTLHRLPCRHSACECMPESGSHVHISLLLQLLILVAKYARYLVMQR